jgi:hypothetical protein
MRKTEDKWQEKVIFYEGTEREYMDWLEEKERKDAEMGWYS